MADVCPICEGTGFRIAERIDGTRSAQPCSCRTKPSELRLLEKARIPERFRHCSFDDYRPNHSGVNRVLSAAVIQARKFVTAYPLETKGRGLLLTGAVGTGKTHLAIATLKSLIKERNAHGLFCDCSTLLDDLRNTYERSVATSERQVMRPILEADVVILDELGAAKVSDWTVDAIARIINARYNNALTTIVTTNYANEPATMSRERDSWVISQETLGDRIGERMRSRLQEMCLEVSLSGADYRASVGRASFAEQKTKRTIPVEDVMPPKLVTEAVLEMSNSPFADAYESGHPVGRERMGPFASKDQPPNESRRGRAAQEG